MKRILFPILLLLSLTACSLAPDSYLSVTPHAGTTGQADPADAVADEIASNLEALVGTTEDTAPKAEPKHPVSDTTSKFATMNLQFGRNYDPTHR